jgi:hypothetical protein
LEGHFYLSWVALCALLNSIYARTNSQSSENVRIDPYIFAQAKPMNPKLSAGELAVSTATHDYLFRPSLAAMASLGSPTEIVDLFALLHSAPKINPYYAAESFRKWERSVLSASIDVLAACCADDITPLVGHIGSRYGSWVPGAMPVEHMPHLARALMKHGITGDVKPRGKPKAEDYSATFDAKDFVATAIAHLGMAEDDAWNLTMTTFAAAMRSKFGAPDDKTAGIENHDDNMARLAAINKLRDRKKA